VGATVPPSTAAAGPPGRRRGPGRVLLLVFGGLFTLAAIGWGVYSVVGLLAHQTVRTPLAFPPGIQRIVVTGGDGSVTLHGSSTRTDVVGERRVEKGLRSPHWRETVDRDAGTLTIDGGCPSFNTVWCSVNYDLEVPAGVSVKVDGDDGTLDVSGVDGDLDLSSGNGSIHVRDIGGDLTLHAANGRIDGEAVRSRVADVSASSGRVELAFATVPDTVRARSSNGRVDVVLPADATAYRVDANSDNGSEDVAVRTDPTSAHRVDASSSNGRVTVRYAGT
jgi:hypothetical protein